MQNEQQTLACAYAALLLADTDNQPSQANLTAVLNAANCAVPAPMVDVFAQASAFRPVFVQALVQQAAMVAPLSAQPTSDTLLDTAAPAAQAADSSDEDEGGGHGCPWGSCDGDDY